MNWYCGPLQRETRTMHIWPNQDGHYVQPHWDPTVCWCQPQLKTENGVVMIIHRVIHEC